MSKLTPYNNIRRGIVFHAASVNNNRYTAENKLEIRSLSHSHWHAFVVAVVDFFLSFLIRN